MENFSALGVIPEFADKLAERRITLPTNIQRMVIKPLLDEKSVIFRSATGTGKTFAYLVPALQRILADADSAASASKAGPALLICAPTFELCSQIKNEADFLLDGKHNVALLIGSADMGRQIDALKKNRPLAAVGNPGRLLMLAKMGRLKLHSLRFVVLDEADRLISKECAEDMQELARLIAGRPVVAACSATVSARVAEILQPLLDGSEILETDEHEILRERIEHWAIFSESRRKTQTLISFLAALKPKKTLVFAGRSYDAGKLVTAMQRKGIAAAGLFSGMNRKDRKEALDRFRSGKAAVLVSSDLAARGLDIPGISHVIALETNEKKDAYIHRAGRTGRAGKRGIMVTIGDEVEMRRLALLEKKLGIAVHPRELYGGRLYKPEEVEESTNYANANE